MYIIIIYKNEIIYIRLIVITKKKKTNITAACSVINPLTSSDSASAKSKGGLLVSAIDPIKNIINIGNKGIRIPIINASNETYHKKKYGDLYYK